MDGNEVNPVGMNKPQEKENWVKVMDLKPMAATASGSVVDNTYRVGEFVYMDSKGSHPYLIRRIEEFTKKENAPNDVRVTIVYRRRDISTAILRVADAAERHWPDYVCYDENTGEEIVPDKVKPEVLDIEEEMDDAPPALSPKEPITENGQSPKKENGTDNHIVTDIKEEIMDDVTPEGEPRSKREDELQPFDWGLGGLPYDACRLSDNERYRLRQREVFLSRKEEKLSASHIRGRCNVNLLCDVETSDDYLSREDFYFYSLVYDNEKLSMLADKGAIRVGNQYQAVVPDYEEVEENGQNGHTEENRQNGAENGDLEEENKENGDLMIDDGEGEENGEGEVKPGEPVEDEREDRNRELEIYRCDNGLSDNDMDRYLIHVRAIGVFARVIDPNSATKYPSAQMIAAIASKDSTILYAMGLLHQAGYDIAKAQDYLVPPPDITRFPVRMEDDMGFNTVTLGGPLLVRDQLEEYSAAESALFEEGLERIGKDFADIRTQLLPWKSLASLVEYYYLYKTTNRYIDGRKKRLAIEKDARILQIYIPSVIHDTSFVIGVPNNGSEKSTSEKGCSVCLGHEAVNWYKWGHRNDDAQLCNECWSYWRQYGGSKCRHRLDHFDTDIAADPDVAQELLKTLSYATPSCSKTAKDPKRYGANSYTMYTVVSAADINAPGGNPGAIANQKKPPTNMRVNLFTRMMRRAIPNSILSIKRVGRQPFTEVNLQRLFSYISTMDQNKLCEVMKSIIAPHQPITPSTFQSMVSNMMTCYLSNNKRPASASLEGQPPLKKPATSPTD